MATRWRGSEKLETNCVRPDGRSPELPTTYFNDATTKYLSIAWELTKFHIRPRGEIFRFRVAAWRYTIERESYI